MAGLCGDREQGMRRPQRNGAQKAETFEAVHRCYLDRDKLDTVERVYKGVFRRNVVGLLNKLPVGLKDDLHSLALTRAVAKLCDHKVRAPYTANEQRDIARQMTEGVARHKLKKEYGYVGHPTHPERAAFQSLTFLLLPPPTLTSGCRCCHSVGNSTLDRLAKEMAKLKAANPTASIIEMANSLDIRRAGHQPLLTDATAALVYGKAHGAAEVGQGQNNTQLRATFQAVVVGLAEAEEDPKRKAVLNGATVTKKGLKGLATQAQRWGLEDAGHQQKASGMSHRRVAAGAEGLNNAMFDSIEGMLATVEIECGVVNLKANLKPCQVRPSLNPRIV